MQFGEDYPKIEVTFLGLNGVEPNALIGDAVLFLCSMMFAFRIRRLQKKHPFYNNWLLFFVVFGISFMAGGLGHFFFNYWGVAGKYAGWFGAVFATCFLERAMISIHPNRSKYKLLSRLTFLKVGISFCAMMLMYGIANLDEDPQKGLLIPSAVIQGLKINFHPWFDRNDFSHLVLLCSLILYWRGIQTFSENEPDHVCEN